MTGTNHNGTGNEFAEFGHIFGALEMRIGDLNIPGGSSPLNRGSIQYGPGVERSNYALSPVFRVRHFLPLEKAMVANFDLYCGHRHSRHLGLTITADGNNAAFEMSAVDRAPWWGRIGLFTNSRFSAIKEKENEPIL